MPRGSPDTEALLRLQVRPLLKNAAMVSLRDRLESWCPADESAVAPDTEALLRRQVRPLLKNAAMVSLRLRLRCWGAPDESAVVCPCWWAIRRCASPCVKQFCSLRTPYSKHNQMI